MKGSEERGGRRTEGDSEFGRAEEGRNYAGHEAEEAAGCDAVNDGEGAESRQVSALGYLFARGFCLRPGGGK